MIKNFLIIVLCSMSFCSCDFLEFDESTGIPKDEAYAYFSNIAKLASGVYNHLPVDYGVINNAIREAATDNATHRYDANSIYDIYTDSWSPLNTIDDQWSPMYSGIRKANSYIENYSEEQLERFKWDKNYEDNMKKARSYINEITVLRAYYHFELAKRYGDIPLLTETYTTESINSVTKTSFDDVINFIVTECDRVIPSLPENQLESGRVTSGFAMALKARALLYAASPLHNSENNKDLWRDAAVAASDIIKSDIYSLPLITADPLYSKNGGNDILSSKQLIFERRASEAKNDFEAKNLPIGFVGASAQNLPTQNLVDAFEMKNGEPFDWANVSHVSNIYYNSAGQPSRDPRFYRTVICNDMTYMNIKIHTYNGGAHGLPLVGATMTGYYLKKLMNETVSLDIINPVKKLHHFPTFRYAEVLLNYAEAMNEWQGADYTDVTCPLSAREALDLVRTAAGMPGVIATGSVFTERLHNERRVELAFEDHRFWDIRRLKIGNVVENIYGVKIIKNGSGLTYTKEMVQSRIWKDKMYIYPIPQGEIFKNRNLLPQYAGWE